MFCTYPYLDGLIVILIIDFISNIFFCLIVYVVDKCYTITPQVWRVNGQEKNLLAATDQSKFYSGDCYIFQYSYPGEDREEHLIGTWIGKNSVEVKDL